MENNKLNTVQIEGVVAVADNQEFDSVDLSDGEIKTLDLPFPEEENTWDNVQSDSTEVDKALNEEVASNAEDSFDSFTIPEKTVEDHAEEIGLEELVLDSFTPSTSTPISKVASVTKGLVSIIYAKTGKRITFDQSLIDTLGLDEIIQVGYNDRQLLLGSNLDSQYQNRHFRKQGTKYVLYDAALIQELIKHFNLDYNNVTSRTFDDVVYKQHQGSKVALITIKKS